MEKKGFNLSIFLFFPIIGFNKNDSMIIGDNISYENPHDISCNGNSSLGSSYKSISLTRDENSMNNIEVDNHLNLVYPFNSLDIIKSKGSTGKCWIFHQKT